MAFNHVYNRNRHLKKHSAQNKQNNDSIESSKTNFKKEISFNSAHTNSANSISSKINSSTDIQITVLPSNPTIKSLIENSFDTNNDSNNNFIVSIKKENFDKINVSNKNSPPTSSENSSNSDNVTSSIVTNITENKSSPLNSLNKNSQEKLFRCHLCYKRFSTEERLDKHSMVHDESAKHLSCHICKRKFLTNSALTCHLKSHRYI